MQLPNLNKCAFNSMFSISRVWGLHFLETPQFMPHNLAGLCCLNLFRQQPPRREIHFGSLVVAIDIFNLV